MNGWQNHFNFLSNKHSFIVFYFNFFAPLVVRDDDIYIYIYVYMYVFNSRVVHFYQLKCFFFFFARKCKKKKESKRSFGLPIQAILILIFIEMSICFINFEILFLTFYSTS